MIKIFKTKLKSLLLVKPNIYKDKRGLFFETYRKSKYQYLLNKIHNKSFIQDNFSFSKKNSLRGLHYSKIMAKLFTVIYGRVYDVCVDLNEESKTYLKWEGRILSSKNYKQLWIPPGFAHGFLVLSAFACVQYKCSKEYSLSLEKDIIWNDKDLNIKWPIKKPILSKKDKTAQSLKNFLNN
jgi:dTDP-4-dehydrorhamnose 3,5-epimerase